jgi:vacuolar-type H+-ATPase subunit F/Vma7
MPDEKNLERTLAIIGEEDVVMGFEALGFRAYAIKDPQELNTVLADATSHKFAICLVEENIYRAHEAEINSYRGLALPVFIPFSKDIKTTFLDSMLREIRLRATGTF